MIYIYNCDILYYISVLYCISIITYHITYICIYTHIHVYSYIIRPISLLTLSLLTLLESRLPGNYLWAWEFHPFKLRLCSSQTP